MLEHGKPGEPFNLLFVTQSIGSFKKLEFLSLIALSFPHVLRGNPLNTDKSVPQRDRQGMTKYYRQVSHIKSGSLLFDESLALYGNILQT